MSGTVFLDSNVLIYLYSQAEPAKQKAARDVIARETCLTGTSNLNEMNHVLIRKKMLTLPQLPAALQNLLSDVDVKTVDVFAIMEALRIMNRYQYSYFDALVIAMALQHGCGTLYSEDMQHGQIIDGKLTIRNIFLTT